MEDACHVEGTVKESVWCWRLFGGGTRTLGTLHVTPQHLHSCMNIGSVLYLLHFMFTVTKRNNSKNIAGYLV
jgi:hypothetical protein